MLILDFHDSFINGRLSGISVSLAKSARCSRCGNNGDGVVGDVTATPMLGKAANPVLWSAQRASALVELTSSIEYGYGMS